MFIIVLADMGLPVISTLLLAAFIYNAEAIKLTPFAFASNMCQDKFIVNETSMNFIVTPILENMYIHFSVILSNGKLTVYRGNSFLTMTDNTFKAFHTSFIHVSLLSKEEHMTWLSNNEDEYAKYNKFKLRMYIIIVDSKIIPISFNLDSNYKVIGFRAESYKSKLCLVNKVSNCNKSEPIEPEKCDSTVLVTRLHDYIVAHEACNASMQYDSKIIYIESITIIILCICILIILICILFKHRYTMIASDNVPI